MKISTIVLPIIFLSLFIVLLFNFTFTSHHLFRKSTQHIIRENIPLDCFQRYHLQDYTSSNHLFQVLNGVSGTRQCPILVFIPSFSCGCKEYCDDLFETLSKREDLLWVNYDLSDHKLAYDDKALRGVTIAPDRYFQQDIWTGERTRLLFYSGGCQHGWCGNHGSHVRPALQTLFGVKYETKSVFFQCKQNYTEGKIYSALEKNKYNTRLMDSVFGLVPHGDGRWNYRFSEVIGAGSIPVILADGLTLPYEQIIDWSKAAVVLPENVIDQLIENGKGVDGLLALLPNKMQARAMLVEVQRIYHTYFETPKKRDAALMAAAYVEAHCRHNGDSGFYKCG